jgi:hypothetical protein
MPAFKFKGAQEMIRRISQTKKQYPFEVEKALYQEAQIEATESKRRCPVAPGGGALRASIHVVGPEWEDKSVFVRIVAGGPSAPYAIAVHEHLSEHSPPTWQPPHSRIKWNVPGTGPKFIESTILESRKHMGKRVAARIQMNRVLTLE